MSNQQVILNRFGTADELEVISRTIPLPQADEARIKIEAASLTSTDLTIRKGLYPLLKINPLLKRWVPLSLNIKSGIE